MKKKEKLINLRRTGLGEVVFMQDPGLQEILTKLLLHAMMLRQNNGAAMWNKIFKNVLPKYRSGIKKDLLILELNQSFENKVTTKNIAPFFCAYEDFFSEFKILSIQDDNVICNSLPYDKEYIYIYMR